MRADELVADLVDWFRENIDGEPSVTEIEASSHGLYVSFDDGSIFNIMVEPL